MLDNRINNGFSKGGWVTKQSSSVPRMYRRRYVGSGLIGAGLLFVCVYAVVSWQDGASNVRGLAEGRKAEFVGRQVCVECHAPQSQSFVGSHHDLAMDLATETSVLATFDNVERTHLGVHARMWKRGEDFMIHTEGPDGEYRDFQIQYVFGVEPLQQYMVELQRDENHQENEVSRLQVLRWSWDVKNKEWFHLDPPDVRERVRFDDPLHWTGAAQRWNTMCAECHSTDLRKNFDVHSNRFATTFSEIDVSCEACHGPASLHMEIVSAKRPRQDANYGWGLPKLNESAIAEIDSCAPCHSRRALVKSGHQTGRSFHDHFAESPLLTNLYFDDGQIRDEVYEHGSFLQSKMYHRGIRCSDCHDPHSAKLKHSGNTLCTSCHQHPEAKYDSVAHHFHEKGKPGSFCVDCHMPTTTYMKVDARRDHSIRIPRPDLSVRLGVPNACSGCHLNPSRIDESLRPELHQYQDWLRLAENGNRAIQEELQRLDAWADSACDRWYGANRNRNPHFAEAMHAAKTSDATAVEKIEAWMRLRGSESPDIARAALMESLGRLDPGRAWEMARKMEADDHPVVRRMAVAAMLSYPELASRAASLKPFLHDPFLSVRAEAGRVYTSMGTPYLNALGTTERDGAINDFRQSLTANSDQAGALLGLGILDEQLGLQQSAIQYYELAIRNEPSATGPRTNLAALLEQLSQGPSSQRTQASGSNPLRERARTLREAELPLLIRDASLMPGSATLQHRLGLAYYLAGRPVDALVALEAAVKLAPNNRSMLMALCLMYKECNQLDQARAWSEKLLQQFPNDEELRLLHQSLR